VKSRPETAQIFGTKSITWIPTYRVQKQTKKSSDGMAIIIAILFGLLMVSALCLYVRTL